MGLGMGSPAASRFRSLWCVAAAMLAASAAQAASPFTVAVLPDTQYYSASYPETFIAQTQWIVDNHLARNIVLATHLGDITETASSEEFDRAAAAMYLLDGAVPWGTCPGNHDIGSPAYAEYLARFGPAHFTGSPGYGGAWGASSCQFFQAGGRTFLAMHLEYHAPPAALSWAQGVLDGHGTSPAIVVTHDYLGYDGRGDYGETLWEDLIRSNEQIFMVLNGHSAGEFHQVSVNDGGLEVFEMLSDYQFYPNGGDGYLRLVEFDEDAGKIRVQTYSPPLDLYETDDDSEFEFSVDFQQRFGPVPEPVTMSLFAPAMWLLRRRRGAGRATFGARHRPRRASILGADFQAASPPRSDAVTRSP